MHRLIALAVLFQHLVLSGTTLQADPLKSLEQWLAATPLSDERLRELATQDFAAEPLTAPQAAAATEMLWKSRSEFLRSDRKAELDAILYNTAEALRALAILLHPVMPATTETLWASLGLKESLAAQKIGDVAAWGQLKPGSVVTKGAVLFPRLEEKA